MSQGTKRTADELENPAKRTKRTADERENPAKRTKPLEPANDEQRKAMARFAAAADNTATLDYLLDEGALSTENAGLALELAAQHDNPVAACWLLANFDLGGHAGQPNDPIARAIDFVIFCHSDAVVDVLVATFNVYEHFPHALSVCMHHVSSTGPGYSPHTKAVRVLGALVTSQHAPTPSNVRRVVEHTVRYAVSRTENAFDMVMGLIDKHPELYGAPDADVVQSALEGGHVRFIGWLLKTKRTTFDPVWLRSIGIGPESADLIDVLLDNGSSVECVADALDMVFGVILQRQSSTIWAQLDARLSVRDELVCVTGEVLPPELANLCGDYFTVLKEPRKE